MASSCEVSQLHVSQVRRQCLSTIAIRNALTSPSQMFDCSEGNNQSATTDIACVSQSLVSLGKRPNIAKLPDLLRGGIE